MYNCIYHFLLSDSVGNHQLITLHNLLQLTQIIYVIYLLAKLKAVTWSTEYRLWDSDYSTDLIESTDQIQNKTEPYGRQKFSILSIVWHWPDDRFEENKDGSDKHGGMDDVQRLDIFLIPATDTAIVKLERTI